MSSPSPKHIVILGPAFPFRGGIADTNEAFARAAMKKGLKVTIVTFTVQYPSFLFPGKTQFRNSEPPSDLAIKRWIHSMNPLTWLAASRRILALEPDLVVLRFWQPLLGPCFGSIARLLKKKVKVIGMTDNIIPHEKQIGSQQFTRYFINACHGFMTLSKAVKGDLENLTSKPADYFPHPINDQLGEIETRENALQKLNLSAENRYMLFFGIVRKYKGLDLLLKAIPFLTGKAAETKLIVAGEFYDDQTEYEAIIKNLNLEEKVILVPRFISDSEIASFFSAADVIVQTYRTATQSGITPMALHFEKPVIVTRVGGMEEFVEEGETGLFAEPDSESIAQTINQFFEMDDQNWVESIRSKKKEYSWDAFVDRLLDFSSERLVS